MKKLVLLLFCILLAAGCKPDYTARIPDGFDAYCQKVMNEWQIPGMAVAVVKDGQTVFLKGYGKTALDERGVPVDETTQFVLASTSKAFTGALLASVMDSTPNLNWDDKVIDHLPDFKYYDDWATRNMMVKEVMAHHNGFKEYALDELPFFGYDRDGLYGLFAAIKPTYSFRSKYAYNNETYTIAAKLIEKYTGEAWEDAIEEKIFTPLGMIHSTTVNKSFYSAEKLAVPYNVENEDGKLVTKERTDRDFAFQWLTAVAPAAAVITKAEDITAWLKMHLNHGVYDGKEVISRKNHDYLFYPQTITVYDSTRLCNYAQGWTIEQNKYGRYIRHTGLAYGYTSIVALVPDLNLGIAVMTNNGESSDPQSAIARQLVDMYYGTKSTDWSAQYLADFMKVEPKKEKDSDVKEPPLADAAYIGEYTHPHFGVSKVFQKGGGLFVKINKLEAQLLHKSGNSFEIDVPGSGKFPIEFKTGAGNRVRAFNLDVGDPTDDFVRK